MKERLTGGAVGIGQSEEAVFVEALIERISQRAARIILEKLQEEPVWVTSGVNY